ncbi:MAG: hypothetical protein MZV63_37685 [Marinilabiliales bacterium]|nr:hypothetical protein [Marinilabiliales bacterium]
MSSFTTAHDEYAIKAFEYAAFDYLLKPIDPDRSSGDPETFHRLGQPLAIAEPPFRGHVLSEERIF